MRFYFAYGSNMWNAQMARRCPHSKKLGLARLPGYRWIISTRGYANVISSAGDEVEGVLFEISPSDEEALDEFEGVAHGSYFKAQLPLYARDEDKPLTALVYIDPITAEGIPKPEYVHRINLGLADAGLSEAYIARHVRKYVPA